MDGFERKKAQNKERLLEATEALLSQHGISKVSVNDIARKAGVAPSTIYNLFGSKDKLISDCIRAISNRLIERFREVSKLDKPYPEKLKDVINFSLEIGLSAPGLSDTDILNNPELRQLRESLYEQERQICLEFIKSGQKQGYLNPDLSDESIETFIKAMIKSMLSDPELYERTCRDPKLFHDFLLIMLYGFGKVK